MDSYQMLLSTISNMQSVGWVNEYFNLVKRLLTEFNLKNDDPRIALTAPDHHKGIHVGFGQRYVMTALQGGYVSMIAPLHFDPEKNNCLDLGYFKRKGAPDARLIAIQWKEGQPIPEPMYLACTEESLNAIANCKKSSFRKFHSPLVYDTIMDSGIRSQIITAAVEMVSQRK